MDLICGEIYRGFELIWSKEVSETKSTAHYFEHKKTGAKLLFLENDDNEKVFSITFKTIPEDDCGTAHILEHTVLQGSKKYPVKTLLWELIKGSMQTYLKAWTSSDHTMYPFASTNEQDFFNLMGVYLDTVFYPKVLENENIFRQEGYRYEINSIDDDIKLNGVVYNEMKAVFSSTKEILDIKSNYYHYPDNCYRFVSGGDPEYIPQLTYEKLTAFHKKYYHPTNSYIYLYGRLDIDKSLQKIDEDYLNNFEHSEIDNKIIEQKPFSSESEFIEYYPIGENVSTDHKSYISFNYTIGHIKDRILNFQFSLLSAILFSYEGAPIKQAILDAGYAENLTCNLRSGIQQPMFSIALHKTDADSIEKARKLIADKLWEIVKNGIPISQIEAALNRKLIPIREAESKDYTKGVLYINRSLKGWLHVDDPLLYLQYDKIIEDFRKSMHEHFFDEIIKMYLIENKYKSTVILIPKSGLQSEKERVLQNSLRQKKDSMTKMELKKLIQTNSEFSNWQKKPDKWQDLQKIPHLKLSDINKESRRIIYEVTEDDKMTVLKTQYKENGLIYLNLKFPATHLNRDEWKWMGLLFWLLKKVDTRNYKYHELAEMINRNTGGIQFNPESKKHVTNHKLDWIGISISTKLLYEKINNLPVMLEELLENSLFEDKKRIEQVLRETLSIYERFIVNAGTPVTINRAYSKINKSFAFIEEIHSLTFYHFLRILIENFDLRFSEIRDNLYSVYKRLFNSNSMLLSINAGSQQQLQMKEQLSKLLMKLDKKITGASRIDFVPEIKHEALEAPVQVQYNTLCGYISNPDIKYSGSLKILSSLLTNDFLQDNIRVKGGAYGIGFNISNDMYLLLISSRDPNLGKTYSAFEKIPDFLRNLSLSDDELIKYKIGALALLDKPLSPEQYLNSAISNHLSGKTYEYEQKIRDEIFATTVDGLRSYADPLEKAIKNGVRCTLGSKSKIEADKALFDDVTKVFE
ncbi:MAG: insulinase family protein [Saprospiraceae bacterium]|nr:insulinase family protein [Saprospiraceae bacterium]